MQGARGRAPALLQRGLAGVVRLGWKLLQSTAEAIAGEPEDSEVLGLLKAQHRQVEQLFAQLERPGGGSRRRALVDELTEALVVHAAIEERHFYPAVWTAVTNDLVAESLEEHKAMKRALLDLVRAAPDDPTWKAKLSTLKEQVLHHAKEEEEKKLFPLVSGMLSADQRAAIAQEMVATMVELQASRRTSSRTLLVADVAAAR